MSFNYELGKEDMSFTGSESFIFDFFSRAGDVEVEELSFITLEKEDGSGITFGKLSCGDWTVYTEGGKNQSSEEDGAKLLISANYGRQKSNEEI